MLVHSRVSDISIPCHIVSALIRAFLNIETLFKDSVLLIVGSTYYSIPSLESGEILSLVGFQVLIRSVAFAPPPSKKIRTKLMQYRYIMGCL